MKNLKPKIEYEIKRPKPKEKRTSFAIIRRLKYPNGKSKSLNLKLKELETINRFYRDGIYEDVDVLRLVKDIRKRLYEESRPPETQPSIHRGNLRVLESYIKDIYSDSRIVDLDSAKFDLQRAVKAVGELFLVKAVQTRATEGRGQPF